MPLQNIVRPMALPILKCLISPREFRFPVSKFILFSTSISTNAITAEQKKQCVMTNFLLTECGFSESQLPTIQMRRESLIKYESTHRAHQALQFLRDSGFTLEQVRKTILRYPNVLQYKVDEQLKPKIHLIKTLGLTDNDVAHVISQRPRILGCSFKALHLKISVLISLFGSEDNLSKALIRKPSLLLFNIDKQLEPGIDILKQSGIQGDLLLYLLLKRHEVLFGNSEESLKLKIEYVRNMGILEGSKSFLIALMAVDNSGLENLEKKLKTLRNSGLLEDEIKLILKKFPSILNLSVVKIQNNMNFLTHIVGFQPNIVVSNPIFLSYSVENRMHPRYKVFEYLRLMQSSQHLPSLAAVIKLSEQEFGEKFLLDNTHAAKIYESHMSKPVDL